MENPGQLRGPAGPGDLGGHFEPSNATSAWFRTLEAVYRRGIECENGTYELLNHTTAFDMEYPVVASKRRGINYRFMAAEARYILSGGVDVRELTKTGVDFDRYADMFPLQQGSYGPMFVEQMRYCVESLLQDELSRQSVMTIWRPNPRPTKDYPCTLSLQFIIRHDRLHCIVNMRSSDCFTGLIYDMFCFSMMANVVLGQLDITDILLGTCYINAGSAHIYNRDLPKTLELLSAVEPRDFVPQPLSPMYLEDAYDWLDNCHKLDDQTAVKKWISNAE